MKDSREIGQSYMRTVAKVFAQWLGGEWRPRPTIVEPMEGWTTKGDLASRGVEHPFVVECKKNEQWVLDGIFDAPKWPIWAWWEQARAQAATVSRSVTVKKNHVPLLIFTRNRRKNYVLAEARVLRWLKVKPLNGPVLTVERDNETPLALCLLGDLVLVDPPSSPYSISPTGGRTR